MSTIDAEQPDHLQSAFALHEPLRAALLAADGSAASGVVVSVRPLVLRALARGDADYSAHVREEIRQLAWVADDTCAPVPADLRAAFTEWDSLLAASLATAAANQSRAASDQFQGVLSERIIQLLADGACWRPSEISAALGVTRSQTSRALRQLRERGLVLPERHAEDGRGTTYRAGAAEPTAVEVSLDAAPEVLADREPATAGAHAALAAAMRSGGAVRAAALESARDAALLLLEGSGGGPDQERRLAALVAVECLTATSAALEELSEVRTQIAALQRAPVLSDSREIGLRQHSGPLVTLTTQEPEIILGGRLGRL